MRQILLIMIGASMLLYSAFSRDSNGLIADSKSGLAWQDDYSDNRGIIKSATWQDALVYCKELTLGGQNDWRLPNIKELKSIVDDTKSNPAISSIFQNITSGYYWSSTTGVFDSSYAWYVYFNYGGDFWYEKYDMRYVRCVRGGQ